MRGAVLVRRPVLIRCPVPNHPAPAPPGAQGRRPGLAGRGPGAGSALARDLHYFWSAR